MVTGNSGSSPKAGRQAIGSLNDAIDSISDIYVTVKNNIRIYRQYFLHGIL